VALVDHAHGLTEPAPADVVARLQAAGCVFAEDEAEILVAAARDPEELTAMVDRRVAGLPIEQVVGWAAFCGLRIEVDPGVFVPRRRSEFLVEQAVAVGSRGVVVLDLCCGSGAVGTAIAAALVDVDLRAADIDPLAVACARRNTAVVDGHVYEGNLYEPLPAGLRGRVDILVANAPYVPTEAIALLPAEAREFEPRKALDGGSDGLDIQRRVIAGASHWLAPGGHLLVETSEAQSSGTVQAFARHELDPAVARSHELDATVVIGEAH
jgi:release factor glutamine methyltransferase